MQQDSRREALDLLRNADAKEVDKENATGNLLLKAVKATTPLQMIRGRSRIYRHP